MRPQHDNIQAGLFNEAYRVAVIEFLIEHAGLNFVVHQAHIGIGRVILQYPQQLSDVHQTTPSQK